MGDQPDDFEKILDMASDSDMFTRDRWPDVALSHWPQVIMTTTPTTFPSGDGWFKKLYDRVNDVVFIPLEMSPDEFEERWPDIKDGLQLLFESPDCAGHSGAIERKGGPLRVMVVGKSRENLHGHQFSFSLIDDPAEEFRNWGPKEPRVGGRERLEQIAAALGMKETVELKETKTFPHRDDQRPWTTPNRKRFKRANRRRK
ncbi:hypothetical protein CPT_Sansa106 [Caulobacter phage Sansa]|uniref:Uncharacterized protein n=1 Tax=Caulobacter phage Sansa TaxID=1675600 RepID=A0A0K1LN04_9CAUD|nr:hypothetical protein HOR07_gp106 [Caulobacter phage Sansa]AKU43510.1 hypothetical protein CPT_Sansa106 [Caulobacter phage Sansa]